MAYINHLKNILRPMGVYDVDTGYGADELTVCAAEFDKVYNALENTQKEMLVPTAENEGLEKYASVLPFVSRENTAALLRSAIISVLQVNGSLCTLSMINSALTALGIAAQAEEAQTAETVNVNFSGARPDNFNALAAIIETLIPCHLSINYVFGGDGQ